MNNIELSDHIRKLRSYGANVKGNSITLYRCANVEPEIINQLRYGDYLSAVADGVDETGNCGAASYGSNCVKFELSVLDVVVTGAGEYQFRGASKSLDCGKKYPLEIYRAYNNAYGSNFSSEEIDAESNVRAIASTALSGGRDKFDALMTTHSS